ncbi:MAG TPA: hypothetical protein VEH84_00175 [Alphaproteobacteria bacterium]|nr:hypothetical protein [Alphaproteobacteria bacterium]
MTDTQTPPPGARPPQVPEKFWDAEAGALRTEALLKSYLELERKLGGMVPLPAEGRADDRLRRALGVPDSHDGYCIDCAHGLFEPDPELNGRLHGAGFSQSQAQLVYDLAAERLVPMLQDLAAEYAADREMERVVQHFGGEDKWREVSRQLLAWGRKNLPGPALDGLATTFDGIVALHRMMAGGEAPALRGGGEAGPAGEAELRRLMRDPRYWRDRDPALVAQVTEGFKRLYPEG